MPIHPRVTRQSLAFVRAFERLRLQAERGPRGVWTIGYGHQRTAREGARISPDDAEALLAYDLTNVATAIEPLIFTPLEPNAFDALLSFTFSTGVEAFRGSEVLRRLNRGLVLSAAAALEAWRCADVGGDVQVVDALVRRRAVEKARFLTPAAGFPVFAGPASPPLRRLAAAPTASELQSSPTRLTARREESAWPPPSTRTQILVAPAAPPWPAESPAERLDRVVTGGRHNSEERADTSRHGHPAEPAPPPFAPADPRSSADLSAPFEPGGIALPPDVDVRDVGRGHTMRAWLELSTVYAAIAILGLGLLLVSIVCILDRPTVGLLALGFIGILAMIPALVRFLAPPRAKGSRG